MWHTLITRDQLPELPAVAGFLFLRFYNMAAGSISHPKDHARFNEFIRHCHARRVKITNVQLNKILIRIGCPEPHANKLSEIYYYGRLLLKADVPLIPKKIT